MTLSLDRFNKALDEKIKKYLVVNAGLIILNLYTGSPFWFIYPLVIWGGVLVFKRTFKRGDNA